MLNATQVSHLLEPQVRNLRTSSRLQKYYKSSLVARNWQHFMLNEAKCYDYPHIASALSQKELCHHPGY